MPYADAALVGDFPHSRLLPTCYTPPSFLGFKHLCRDKLGAYRILLIVLVTQYIQLLVADMAHAGKNSVGQIIKACVTVFAFIALTGGFGVIKAALDDLFGLTRGAVNTVWPAQVADGLITLHIIDQVLDIDLHRWTPVRGGNMGWHQYMTSSNSMTLESNKSLQNKRNVS